MTTRNLQLFTRKAVSAKRVPECDRMNAFPRHFGRDMMKVEGTIYDLLAQFSPEYTGGYWHFYDLSNGGFYMAPTMEPASFHVPSNGFTGTMTGDAAGITVCLFVFGTLSFGPTNQRFVQHFHRLRDFTRDHKEHALIFRAID
jgi:Antirestriction protein